jgi:hypothetical protein
MPDDRPISLSDAQLDAVMLAAQPIDRRHRSAFLEAVAAQLQAISDPGDGDVARAIRSVQRLYFDPPLATERPPQQLVRKAGR